MVHLYGINDNFSTHILLLHNCLTIFQLFIALYLNFSWSHSVSPHLHIPGHIPILNTPNLLSPIYISHFSTFSNIYIFYTTFFSSHISLLTLLFYVDFPGSIRLGRFTGFFMVFFHLAVRKSVKLSLNLFTVIAW